VDGVGGEYSGNSAAIDYKGFAMAECSGEETMTIALDKEKLATFRQRWPLYLDFD
jgi:predicted amidohydrolase